MMVWVRWVSLCLVVVLYVFGVGCGEPPLIKRKVSKLKLNGSLNCSMSNTPPNLSGSWNHRISGANVEVGYALATRGEDVYVAFTSRSTSLLYSVTQWIPQELRNNALCLLQTSQQHGGFKEGIWVIRYHRNGTSDATSTKPTQLFYVASMEEGRVNDLHVDSYGKLRLVGDFGVALRPSGQSTVNLAPSQRAGFYIQLDHNGDFLESAILRRKDTLQSKTNTIRKLSFAEYKLNRLAKEQSPRDPLHQEVIKPPDLPALYPDLIHQRVFVAYVDGGSVLEYRQKGVAGVKLTFFRKTGMLLFGWNTKYNVSVNSYQSFWFHVTEQTTGYDLALKAYDMPSSEYPELYLYVCGEFPFVKSAEGGLMSNETFPPTLTIPQGTTTHDGFVARFHIPTKTWSWSVRFGGKSQAACQHVVSTGKDSVYVLGSFAGTLSSSQVPSYTFKSISGSLDIFRFRVALSGDDWEKGPSSLSINDANAVGGEDHDTPSGLAISTHLDGSHSVYFAGVYKKELRAHYKGSHFYLCSGVDFPGSVQFTQDLGENSFVASFSNHFPPTYCSSDGVAILDIATDSYQGIFVTGWYYGIFGPNALHQRFWDPKDPSALTQKVTMSNSGQADAFLVRIRN